MHDRPDTFFHYVHARRNEVFEDDRRRQITKTAEARTLLALTGFALLTMFLASLF